MMSNFTSAFENEPQTFTQFSRSPIGIYLKPSNQVKGLRSLVSEKIIDEDEEPTILMTLGNILEKFLTLEKDDYFKMLKTSSTQFIPKSDEAYNNLKVTRCLFLLIYNCSQVW